jgi:mannan endo-1,6-alpha-mannosidase
LTIQVRVNPSTRRVSCSAADTSIFPESIRDAAATVAFGVQSLYNGNKTGGVLGKWPFPPYYWWESGAAWGGMVSYWHYTGDNSYVNVTYEALVSQIGPTNNFILPQEKFNTVLRRAGQTSALTDSLQGNDDQAFWVLAAMSAAEYGFPQPPAPHPSWRQICDNAFNDYVQRWEFDSDVCSGGLRWQFTPENAGHDYKNSISNGGFFQLASRLARMTGNQTYVDWAEKIWDWTTAIGLIDNIYNVFDGTDLLINCTHINHNQWTYNVAIYLYGAAAMQNYTNATQKWVTRTTGLLDATSTFFSPFPNATNIMFEAMCEKSSTCNVDQYSMKAYLARWLAGTSLLAPYTAGRIGELLRASAIGASNACTAGPFGNTCGSKWYLKGTDGTSGLGQQLSALEAMYALLVNGTTPPSVLNSVRIRDAPPNVATVPPNPSANRARPLYDEGGRLPVAFSLPFGVAMSVAILMIGVV